MMTDQMLLGALALVLLIVFVLLGYLVGSRQRSARGNQPAPVVLPPGMEALAPAFTELRGYLESVRGQVEGVEKQLGELRGGLDQVSTAASARRGQEDDAWQRIGRVETELAKLQSVPDATLSLRTELSQAVQALADLKTIQAEAKARWGTEDSAFGSLQRLSAVLLGSATAGASGERIVEEMLSTLPPQWVVTNHKVGNKPVEFAIRLPDGLILPVDSKVAAQTQLDTLDRATDPSQRASLEKEIRSKVLARVSEVRQYVDDRTPGFAIAAVSDAAYRLCAPVLPQAYQEHHALIVPYSLLAPFVLMIYEQHRRNGIDLDSARMATLLSNAADHVAEALREVNSRMANGLTQVNNAHGELRRILGDAERELALVRGASETVNAASRARVS